MCTERFPCGGEVDLPADEFEMPFANKIARTIFNFSGSSLFFFFRSILLSTTFHRISFSSFFFFS
tara:strand:+ start:929 stop:1123 length:195 start_codon:yes stop_codon:yes gene_type:complete